MASAGMAAYGTLLQIDDGAGNYTTIAEVYNIQGPKFKTDVKDVTSHSSPNAWKEKIPTLIDPGQITFDVNFVPTSATQSQSGGLIRDQKNRTKRNFKVVFPDGGATTWTIAAYVIDTDIKAPVDDKLMGAFILELTGQPTLAG